MAVHAIQGASGYQRPPAESLAGYPGQVLSHYRLEELIGCGGMGEVWRARQLTTGTMVGLKMLRSTLRHLPEMRQSLSREIRAASTARHPNVVEVLDAFDGPGDTPVMIMPLLEGETLAAHLERKGALSIDETLSLLTPVLAAMECAHDAGVVHRDLKPENIFLMRQHDRMTVKVLDFGIAQIAEDSTLDSCVATTGGAFLGTPAYMAPEQAFGESDLDQRVDVWALGVILYECLSGLRPIEGGNIGQIVKHLLTQAITPLEVVTPGLPLGLSKLVMRMLTRPRGSRPSNLTAIRLELSRYAGKGQRRGAERASDAPPESQARPILRANDYGVLAAAGSERQVHTNDLGRMSRDRFDGCLRRMRQYNG